MKRVGAAMLEALKRGDDTSRVAGMRGLALSENDAGILSFLSHRPCSTISQISRAQKISQTAVKWHVRKLKKAELLASRELKSREAFYLAGMLAENEHELFSLLADQKIRALVSEVISRPGSDQNALSRKLGASRQTISRGMRRLEDSGLVVVVRDGRNVRYYLTERLTEAAEAFLDRRKFLLDATVSKLATMGLQPKIIKSEPAEVHILIGSRGMRASLRLGLNPFVTLLWD
jgi:DNA-binding transcriptional ArsR family regulator